MEVIGVRAFQQGKDNPSWSPTASPEDNSCKLQSFDSAANLQSIGRFAFEGQRLSVLHIPGKLKEIEQ